MGQTFPGKRVFGLFATIAVLAGGCSNDFFERARQVSDNSKKLKEVFLVLATDYVESCFRRANYGLLTTSPEGDFFGQRDNLMESCNFKLPDEEMTTKENAKVAFITQNNIIADYLDAIGTLSDKKTFDFSEEASSIQGVLERAGLDLSDSKGTVFGSVVGFIFQTISQDIARSALKDEVPRVNEPFQQAICFLKKDFDTIYRRALEQERTQMDTYYESTITVMLQRSRNESERDALSIQQLRQDLYNEVPSADSLPVAFSALPEVYDFYDEWREQQAELRQRFQALDQYLGVLSTIASGHESLAKASEEENFNPVNLDDNCEPMVVAEEIDPFVSQRIELANALYYLDDFDNKVSELQDNQFIRQEIGQE